MTIQSKVPTNQYREAWDKIFGNKKPDEPNPIAERNKELIKGKDALSKPSQ